VLEREIASRQSRVDGRPPPDVCHLSRFAEALNRWHLSDAPRLLWVDSWNNDFPSAYATFMAARAGLGEARSLFDAPGHYFDSYPYHERDQTEISPEHAQQTGIMVGLMSLVVMSGWDGWLLVEGSNDRIEFWEGNVFFYSTERQHLTNAESLMNEFGCPRKLA
jgi:hypothetical protein